MSPRVLGISLFILSSLAFSETVTLRPGAEGKDAIIFNRTDAKGKNYGSSKQFVAETWTWDADNLGTGTHRGLIEFDLKAVPEAVTFKSAKLHLYCDTVNYTKGHSSLSTSNAAYLQRVKTAWVESTVTWNDQPAADTVGQLTLAKSKAAVQDYVVDVSAMVRSMLEDSSTNHGFLLRSITETKYNVMAFASGDHPDTNLHPKLEVEYEMIATGAGRIGSAGKVSVEPLRYRKSADELVLFRPASGAILDLHGKVVARIGKTGSVSIGGLERGAYILRSGGEAVKIVLP